MHVVAAILTVNGFTLLCILYSCSLYNKTYMVCRLVRHWDNVYRNVSGTRLHLVMTFWLRDIHISMSHATARWHV